jgi:hypothetical protein
MPQGNAILNLRTERPPRELIVCRTWLEHLNEGKAAVLQGGPEHASHQFDVAADATSNEGEVEREDQVHARQRVLGDQVGVITPS